MENAIPNRGILASLMISHFPPAFKLRDQFLFRGNRTPYGKPYRASRSVAREQKFIQTKNINCILSTSLRSWWDFLAAELLAPRGIFRERNISTRARKFRQIRRLQCIQGSVYKYSRTPVTRTRIIRTPLLTRTKFHFP